MTVTPSSVNEAIAALDRLIVPVETERLPWRRCVGRVLSDALRLDRPSPACDVSAMDGYAIGRATRRGRLRVVGEAAPGRPAPVMPEAPGETVRVFTGAPVPAGAQSIIAREKVTELGNEIELGADADIHEGMNIRFAGENGRAGDIVCEPGVRAGMGGLGALASCGDANPRVFRQLCIAVLVTGDEVLPVESAPQAWQLRDSNGPALVAMLEPEAWVGECRVVPVADQREETQRQIKSALEWADALVITGGVSAGDHDYVPAAIRGAGCEVVFHKLAVRPGKPVLGAVSPAGKPVIGLPGNPVSVMVMGRLIAMRALSRRAGLSDQERPTLVRIESAATAPERLTWYPLVRLTSPGKAELVRGKGSGDWIAAARSDGFIEVDPGAEASGYRSFFSW
jgi:molybdopterin molybdotransferase